MNTRFTKEQKNNMLSGVEQMMKRQKENMKLKDKLYSNIKKFKLNDERYYRVLIENTIDHKNFTVTLYNRYNSTEGVYLPFNHKNVENLGKVYKALKSLIKGFKHRYKEQN